MLVIEAEELKLQSLVDRAVHLGHGEGQLISAARLIACCHHLVLGRPLVPWVADPIALVGIALYEGLLELELLRLSRAHLGLSSPWLVIVVLLVLEIHGVALPSRNYLRIPKHTLGLHVLGPRPDGRTHPAVLLLLLIHHHLV